MEQEVKLLEVGMVLFEYNNWGTLSKHEVTKVTPKQAIAGNLTVKREIIREKNFGSAKIRPKVRKIGSYGHAYLQTNELLSEYRTQNLISKAKMLHRAFKESLIDETNAKSVIEFYESFTPTEVKS